MNWYAGSKRIQPGESIRFDGGRGRIKLEPGVVPDQPWQIFLDGAAISWRRSYEGAVDLLRGKGVRIEKPVTGEGK